jgi:hypothetical protein
MINLEQYPVKRESLYSEDDLIKFEELMVSHWEAAKIRIYIYPMKTKNNL